MRLFLLLAVSALLCLVLLAAFRILARGTRAAREERERRERR